MRVLVIRTDGQEETHEVTRQTALQEIYQLIGCDTVDSVDLRDGRVMLVDDNGYDCEFVTHAPGRFEFKPTHARKPVNPRATAIYHAVCVPGTTHAIVGDVAIVVDKDFA